jgi:hypothetical protein
MNAPYRTFCTTSRLFAAISALAVTCAIFISVASGMTGDLSAALGNAAAAAEAAMAPCVPTGTAA